MRQTGFDSADGSAAFSSPAHLASLDRRRFLLGAGSLVALGAAGCSASPAGSGGSTGGAGGSIDTFTAVFQGWGAAESLDPGVNTFFVDEARFRALFDYLFELDDTMTPVPRLAEKAEPNAKGDVWRVHLRDARWHDGTALTADDVLYTVSRVLGPPGAKPFGAAAAMKVVDLRRSRKVDDRTVEFGLNAPSFDFPTTLGVYGMRIVKNGATTFDTPVGTGPFRFESFQAGTQMTATSYEHYWDGAPAIQRLRILSSEPDARANAVLTGQADYADELSPTAASQITSSRRATVHEAAGSQILSFVMKCASGPFADPKVRAALFSAVDRDEMVKVALNGQGRPANDLFGQGYRYYASDIPTRTFDPEAARKALAAAGHSDLAFSLFTAPASNGMVESAKLLVQQAQRSGMKVDLQTGSKDTYYTEQKTRGDLVMSQSGPMPLPNHFALRLLSSSKRNVAQWNDPEFDSLYAKAQATADLTARTKVYHDMQAILHERGPWLIYATSSWRTALGPGFTGYTPAPTNTVNWARFDKVKKA